jgi:class 3 adenylate cyclase
MHKDLRALLHDARGESQHAVIIFLDIRGFSSFAKIAESSDAAEFLKSAYIRILDDFMPDADFFKLTGDGMLAIFRFERDSLEEVVRHAVDVSIKLVEVFPDICQDDPMVNFPVPGELGVGLARGAVTCLRSGDKVLDYSGRPLNLASRLMDLARPKGVVFDESFGFALLTPAVQERFVQEMVYIKGIAEDAPLTAYVLEGVEIPAYNRSPLNRFEQFREKPETYKLKDLDDRGGRYQYPLTHEPARTDQIDVHITWPSVQKNGTKHPKLWTNKTIRARHMFARGRHFAEIDYRAVVQEMRDQGVRGTWTLGGLVEYPIVPIETNAGDDDAPAS